MFYDNFLFLCKLKHVTPSAVMRAIGLNKSSATYWKNGSMPSSETLKKVADYFGVTTDALLNGDYLQKFSDFMADKLKGKVQVGYVGEDGSLEGSHDMTGDEVLEILRTPSRKDRYLELFDKLNPMGQRIAVERVEELTEIPKYQRQETPLEVPQAPPEGTGDIPLPESLSEGAETLPESQEVDWGKPQGDEVW